MPDNKGEKERLLGDREIWEVKCQWCGKPYPECDCDYGKDFSDRFSPVAKIGGGD